MTEFLSCRPNLEVGDLAPAAAFLHDVLGFEVEVDEPEMGLMLLRRDAVGLALVRSADPGINTTTAAYIGVTGVDDLHAQCAARGAPVVTGLTDHPWGRLPCRMLDDTMGPTLVCGLEPGDSPRRRTCTCSSCGPPGQVACSGEGVWCAAAGTSASWPGSF